MREVSLHSMEKFRELVESIDGLPTDHIIAILDKAKYWDADELEKATLDYKRNFVRNALGRVKTDDGNRLFVSVETVKGKRRVRVYKNRKMMSVADFRWAINYYASLGQRGYAFARLLVKDCKAIHGVQLKFDFAVAK